MKQALIRHTIAIIILALYSLLNPPSAIACPLYTQAPSISINGLGEEQCIDIGGYQLYMQTAGKAGPQVIFESGLGDSSWSWDKVVPQVAKFSKTVVYDRNGLGNSQTKPHETAPRTAQQAVDNLRAILKKANILPPYILVGHSLGGLYMQLYAQEYPKEVAGVILVDSATSDQSGDDPLPPTDARYYLEAKAMKESIEQIKKAPPFPSVPLIILTSGQRGQKWLDLQDRLKQLSPQSQQFITQKSGHYIQREEPDMVINAILQLADIANQ